MPWPKRGWTLPGVPSFQPLAAAQQDLEFMDGFEHGVTGAEACPPDRSDRWVNGFETGLRQLMSATPLLQ
jgi:hypothetical protein